MVHLPMTGIRVLEVAQFTFTPAAGAVLTEWGADNERLESKTHDRSRSFLIILESSALATRTSSSRGSQRHSDQEPPMKYAS